MTEEEKEEVATTLYLKVRTHLLKCKTVGEVTYAIGPTMLLLVDVMQQVKGQEYTESFLEYAKAVRDDKSPSTCEDEECTCGLNINDLIGQMIKNA